MKKVNRKLFLIPILAIIGITLTWNTSNSQAQELENSPYIIGIIFDEQGQQIVDAEVSLISNVDSEPLSKTNTQPDGRYNLEVTDRIPDFLSIHIERPHFEKVTLELNQAQIQSLRSGETLSIEDTVLLRRINPAFWIASVIFVIVLVLIATGKLHNTLAAMLGMSLLFIISYIGGYINEDLFIFDFEGSLNYVDWNVIFLIMGMMIVIAIVEKTGIFQWLAFFAYRISGGRMWLLLTILMLITGVASAFLDNVTTMLLMTPISVQIALALGINPLALLMPEVMASNVIGVSTLVGTPTNILIGSYGDISFNDFLTNLTPGVILAFIGLLLYCGLIFRKDLAKAHAPSPLLLEKLAEHGEITQPVHLKKAGWVGLGMVILFVFGEKIHLLPAVTALIGATALLVWIKPNIEEMIEEVDWTTLVFFISLFIVVGAIQEAGLISFIATGISQMVGSSLILSMLAVIWLSAILSTIIANIPFTAAMLPVIGFLTATVPGANTKVLFYCLSVGSAMGGNGSLIGASANMVTAGIAEAAGFRISYGYFLKKGFPALLITVSLATIWLLIRFH
ncbi:MAG: ArsB/NhaD family transporter [Chloroflexi bacterium]|nr:ArsB/NhaD family transporter [Chloroflexota bacterium]